MNNRQLNPNELAIIVSNLLSGDRKLSIWHIPLSSSLVEFR